MIVRIYRLRWSIVRENSHNFARRKAGFHLIGFSDKNLSMVNDQ